LPGSARIRMRADAPRGIGLAQDGMGSLPAGSRSGCRAQGAFFMRTGTGLQHWPE